MSVEKEVRTVTKQVDNMLSMFPETRDSDKKLTIAVWVTYYQSYVGTDGRVALEDIMHLPSQDLIKRVRAHIQNDEKRFLPTSWEVAKQRKWNELEYRRIYGQPKQGELF